MAISNVNSETGIRFGTIYGNDCPHLMEAIFEQGTDVSYENWRRETLDTIKRLLDDGDASDLATFIRENAGYLHREKADEIAAEIIAEQRAEENGEDATDDDADGVFMRLDLGEQYENDEPTYQYTDKDGNKFQMSYLGGAPLIWCVKTDKVVSVCRLCSPCVPNAGDLGSGILTGDEADGGYRCYGVPDKYL